MFDSHSSVFGAQNTRHLVAELQEERSQVWGLYCQIADMKAHFASAEIRPLLADFLGLLIDYVSLGHFGVYEYLTKNCQPEQLSIAGQVYPMFTKTTASAVTFCDRYENRNRNFKADHLMQDLSTLGESLAERMELEDRLCSMLLH